MDRLDIHVEPGELYCFLGPNGAGKTTTIKMITGLLRPDSGKIEINGFDMMEHELDAKQSFGFIPDRPFLYDRLTTREFLRFIGGLYRMKPAVCDARIDEFMTLFELTDFENELIASFSHGMRQKVSLAAAMIHNPPVLIIDEPMVGLDPKGAVTLKNILREYCAKGLTAFVSTHSLDVAEELAHRIGIIHFGRLVAEGTMDHLRTLLRDEHLHLEDIFLQLTSEDSGSMHRFRSGKQ